MREENHHRGHDVVFQRRGIHRHEVRLFEIRKEEGLGGQPVDLVEEHHHHGDLRDGAIDAQLRHGHPLGQQELDELAVDELVGRTGQAAHQQRQRIGENGRQQLPVDRRQRAVGGGEYHQPRHRAGDEVGDEDPPHAEVGGEESRDAEGDGQRDVEHRAQRLDSDEGERAPLLTKPRKGNAGPDVEQDDEADPNDVFGVRDIGFAHQAGDVAAEKDHRRDEKQRRERRGAPGRGEEPPFGPPHVAARRLGPGRKAEIARLHAHRQERERQRNQGIDVGDDSVGLLPEFTGIVRREQIAQETHRDRADAVNGGICLASFSSIKSA